MTKAMNTKADVPFVMIMFVVAIVAGLVMIIIIAKPAGLFSGAIANDCEEKGFQCVLSKSECDSDQRYQIRGCNPKKWQELVKLNYDSEKLFERYETEIKDSKGDKILINKDDTEYNIGQIARALCPVKSTALKPKKKCGCCVKPLGLLT